MPALAIIVGVDDEALLAHGDEPVAGMHDVGEQGMSGVAYGNGWPFYRSYQIIRSGWARGQQANHETKLSEFAHPKSVHRGKNFPNVFWSG
jgi:hypothetical protein